jgi:hypothetical protein
MADGVYFLANDVVYDFAIAFLNSLRTTNPTIPLCLIPFSAEIHRLQKEANRYNFLVLDDPSLLQRCDRISESIHHTTIGHYRKLAAWEGVFDRFIYVDVDTIILDDVTIAFPFLEQFDYIASHSRVADSRRWVWKDSIYNTSVLTHSQIDYAANTGFICSQHGAMTVKEAEDKVESAIALAPHMELRSFEQPFLNYLVVTSGGQYTSLLELNYAHKFLGLPREVWAGEPGGIVDKGNLLFPGRRERVLFVHWAGQWSRKPNRDTALDDPSDRMHMPYDALWQYYRQLGRH